MGSERRDHEFRPRSRRPTPVHGALVSALKRYGLAEGFARYQFVSCWDDIVGKEIAKRARPEYLRGGTLVVRVCNSAWAQELSFQKQVILKRLQRFADPAVTVKDIAFCVAGER